MEQDWAQHDESSSTHSVSAVAATCKTIVDREQDPRTDTTGDQGSGQQLGIRAPASNPLEQSVPRHQAQQQQRCGLQHNHQRVMAAHGCSIMSPCKRARTMISPFMEMSAAHHIRDPAASVDGSSAATVLGWATAGQGGAADCKWSAANSSMEECRSLPTELCNSSITSQRQVSPLQQQQQPQQQTQQPEGLVLASRLAETPAAAAAVVPRGRTPPHSDTPPMEILNGGSSPAQNPAPGLLQQQQQQQPDRPLRQMYAAVPEAPSTISTAAATDGAPAVAAAPSASLRHLSALAALPTQQLHKLLLIIDGQVRQRQEVSCRPQAGPADDPDAQRKLRTLMKLRSQVSRHLLARHKLLDTAQPPAAAAAATASGATAEAAHMAQDGCAVQQPVHAAAHKQTKHQIQAEWQQQGGHQHAEQQQHRQQQQSRLLQQTMQPKDSMQQQWMRQAVLGRQQQQLLLLPTYYHQQQQQDYRYEAPPPCNTVKQQQQTAGALLRPAMAATLPEPAAAGQRNSRSTTPSMSTSSPTPAPPQICSAGTAAAAGAGCDLAPVAAAAAPSDSARSTHEATQMCKRKRKPDSLALWGCYQGLSVTDIPPGWHSNVLQGLEEAVPQGLGCPMLLDQAVETRNMVSGLPGLELGVQPDQEQVQVQMLPNASSRFSCNASPGSKSPGPAAGSPSPLTLAAAAALTPTNVTLNSATAAAAAAAMTSVIPATAQTPSPGTTAMHSNKQQPPDLPSAVSGGDGSGPHSAAAVAAVEAEAALPARYESDPFISVDDFLDGLCDLKALAATPPPQQLQTSMLGQSHEAPGWQQQHQQYRPGSSSDGLGALDFMWADRSYAPVLSDHEGAAAAAVTTPSPPVPPPLPAGVAAVMIGRTPLPHGAMAYNREQQQVGARYHSRSQVAPTQQQQRQQQFAEGVSMEPQGRLLFDQHQQQQQQFQDAHSRRVTRQQGSRDQSMGGLVPNLQSVGTVTDTAAVTAAPVLGSRNISKSQYMFETASTRAALTPHQYQQQQQHTADQWARPYRNSLQLHAWTQQFAAKELPQIWMDTQNQQQQTHMMQPSWPRPPSIGLNQLDPTFTAAAAGYPMSYRPQDPGNSSNDQQQQWPGIAERLQQWQEQQQQWQQFFRSSKLPPAGSVKYQRLQQVWAVIKARDLVKQLPQEAVAMMAQLDNSNTAAAIASMGCQQQQAEHLAADVSLASFGGGRHALQQQQEWAQQNGSRYLICPQAAQQKHAAGWSDVCPGTGFSEVDKTASGELTAALGLLRTHSGPTHYDAPMTYDTAVAAAAEAAHLQASLLQLSRCPTSSQQPRPLATPWAAAAAMQTCQSTSHMMSSGSGRWLQPAVNALDATTMPLPTPATSVLGSAQTSLAARANTHMPQQLAIPGNGCCLSAVARPPSSAAGVAPPTAAAGPDSAQSPAGGPVTPQSPAAATAEAAKAVDATCESPFTRVCGTAAAFNPDLATLDEEDTSWLEGLDADLHGAQHSLPMLPLTASTEIEISRLM